MSRDHLHRVVLSFALATSALLTGELAQAGGTRFVLQLQGGFSSSPADDMGLSLGYGLVAGYGGRLRNTRLRFYGIASFDRAAFSSSGLQAQTGQTWSAERSYNDFQGGLRLLIPIWWRLRWYLEVLLGASYLTGEVSRLGAEAYESTGWSALLTATTGFEVRWHPHMATGLRGELHWMMTGGEVLDVSLGQAPAEELRITVVATQAFLF